MNSYDIGDEVIIITNRDGLGIDFRHRLKESDTDKLFNSILSREGSILKGIIKEVLLPSHRLREKGDDDIWYTITIKDNNSVMLKESTLDEYREMYRVIKINKIIDG